MIKLSLLTISPFFQMIPLSIVSCCYYPKIIIISYDYALIPNNLYALLNDAVVNWKLLQTNSRNSESILDPMWIRWWIKDNFKRVCYNFGITLIYSAALWDSFLFHFNQKNHSKYFRSEFELIPNIYAVVPSNFNVFLKDCKSVDSYANRIHIIRCQNKVLSREFVIFPA